MMKQSTSFTQVVTNLLNVLQGYTKGIRFVVVLTMLLSIGVGKAWADYTITFKTSGNNNDGSQAQTTIANLISSGGGYVSTISATKAYNGKNGYGVKLGSSSAVGNVSMNLTSNGNNIGQIKASKLIVNAAYFKQGPTLKVTATYSDNSTVSQSLSLTASIAAYDVTLSSTKTLKSIKIESVAGSSEERVYCHSIQVVAAAAVSTYTVTYDLNGGTGTTPTQANVAAGGTFTLAASSGFSKAGYSFAGWNDGTTTYNAGATYTMPAKAVTLKAQWTALPKYTVTLVPGSGSVTNTELEEPNAGAGVTLPTPTLDCGDWEFAGWKTTSAVTTETTTEPTLIPAGAYSPTSDITLYAVYQRTVTTSGGGGGGSSTPITTDDIFENGGTYTAANGDVKAYITWTEANVVSIRQEQGSSTSPVNSSYVQDPRWYASHQITITPSVNISAITIQTQESKYTTALTEATYTNATASSSSNTVTITPTNGNETITISMGSQARLYTLTVTYASGGGSSSTTYYHSTPDCGSTEPSRCLTPKYGGDSGGTWRVVIEWYPKWQATCGGKQK